MLSWEEFDKPEDAVAANKPATAEESPAMSLEKLDSVGDAAAHEPAPSTPTTPPPWPAPRPR